MYSAACNASLDILKYFGQPKKCFQCIKEEMVVGCPGSIKDNLKKFTLKNRQRLACSRFFWESVPFSYCPGKEGKSKNTPYVLSVQ